MAGIGEAALFVGAATLVADLAPPHRRAEAASYFSVAVFGGLGIGPIIGDAVLGNDNYGRAFLVAGAFAWLAAARVAVRAPRRADRTPSTSRPTSCPSAAGWERIMHPAAVGPGSRAGVRHRRVRRVHGVPARVLRDRRFAGSGGLFAAYSVVCLLLRLAGARWLERLGVRNSALIAFTSARPGPRRAGDRSRTPGRCGWPPGSSAFASAFLYPSLMALTVNQADERERPLAISSFTMFFEVGNISGGVVFGLIAQLGSKRAAFGSAVVLCVLGTWLLVTRVVPRHVTRRRLERRVTGPVAVVVD